MIDDPFGTMEDAKSPAIRDKVWDWYNGTVYNRLQPHGAIVLINHRMHEDDLSGRLIEKMKAGGDRWTIVKLPAIATGEGDLTGRAAGEPLWPESYPLSALRRIQSNTLARYWSALYQQNPVPDEGELFSPDRIGLRDRTDDVVLWVRGWDLAGSVEGDWTVGALLAGRPSADPNAIRPDSVRLEANRPSTSEPRFPPACPLGPAQSSTPTSKVRHCAADPLALGRAPPERHEDSLEPGLSRFGWRS
jgi:hypothetical protein